jgi:hypothetical protein
VFQHSIQIRWLYAFGLRNCVDNLLKHFELLRLCVR